MELLVFNKIYEENKKLDELFNKLYGNSEEIVRKNKLELLVELGELANETKCFKYWSVKMPNKNMVLEEYADSLLMVFYMFNDLDVSLNDEFPVENEFDLIDEFLYLFNIASKLKDDYNKNIVKDIFINLIRLGHLLEFNDEEIISGCLKKININKERFEINY